MQGIYIIYLRKSRQDDPRETVEEVLAKHETMLQEYAQKELGGRIPEENIYREVVSGESIDDRVEIQKVLARIEDPNVKGVLVVEPQRLSRGDLIDCGQLMSNLQYTHTNVVTPYMTYNMENKMERKFFQDELLRGRDYLEYTKEILWRGRVAAIKRGCYIGTVPPYGYKKVKIGKDHTLEIFDEEAEVVRLVFDLYTRKGVTPGLIAQHLTKMGVPGPIREKWGKASIQNMLRNRHYIGKVVFNRIKKMTVIENGEKLAKRVRQQADDVIIAEGKHPAIIDMETWEAAQKIVANNPRFKRSTALKNILSGVMFCAKCGLAMKLHPYKLAADRYECPQLRRCFKSVKADAVNQAVLMALEEAELPALELKVKNDDGNAVKIQQKLLEKLEKKMQEYREQEEKQFDLLETGVYSQDLFERRNAALRDKMEDCQKQIYQTKSTMPTAVDYTERVAALKDAIAMMKDPTATAEEKNKLLRAIVKRIEFTGTPSEGVKKKGVKQNDNNPFSLKVFLRL